VKAEIEVKSLTTGHAERDEHLLSADYFEAEKYPKIFFRSKKVEPKRGNRGMVTGDLIIRGSRGPPHWTLSISARSKAHLAESHASFFRYRKGQSRGLWDDVSHPMEGGGFVVGKDVSNPH